MKRPFPSRFRRLDGALADLPLDDPMLLTTLDGFLTGIVVCSDAIAPAEWMLDVWGAETDGMPAFDDPIDVRWFAGAVMARHDEIARDLVRGKPQPIFDVDERTGELIWEDWIDGFAMAMDLRPDAWPAIGALAELIAVAREESDLDSIAINALQDAAPATINASVLALYAACQRHAGAVTTPPAKVGRNDPCACGSRKKSKRCCG